jgi:hypothetical protein
LRRWAEQSGVFSQGRTAQTATQTDPLSSNDMFAGSAGRAFVSKPITAVGFAASGRREPRVFVYTRRNLTKAEKKKLEDENKLGLPIEFRVALPFGVTGPTTAARFPTMFKEGRLTCGTSISVGNDREAGTLGALLKDDSGALFGLSCNHVTGRCSNSRVELPIVAPGILDVGAGVPYPRTIGFHDKALQFIQGDPTTVANFAGNIDAAIFKIRSAAEVSSLQGDQYDTPSVVGDPEEDMPIEKVGRTTGHTSGIIESQVSGPLRVDYKATAYHSAEEDTTFQGSVFFEPVFTLHGIGGPFAQPGDSGALVISREDKQRPVAVGLIIGGRPGEEVTYMVPLRPIIEKFGLTLVSGHGVPI